MNLSDEDFQNAAELIRSSQFRAISYISSFSGISGKYRNLLKVGNAEVVTISPEERSFILSEIAYIDRIEVVGPDSIKIQKGFALTVVGHDGARVEIPGVESESRKAGGSEGAVVVFSVNRVCSAITIRSTMKWRQLKLVRFGVVGYTILGLERVVGQVRDLEILLSRIDSYVAKKITVVGAAEARALELESGISDLQASKEDAIGERDRLQEEVEGLQASAAENRALTEQRVRDLKDVQSRIEIATNNESQLRLSVEVLNKNLSEKNVELRRLANDRNLISDEYRDYVGEGKKQSRVYEWFLYFSIFVIGIAAVQLYSGAERILNAEISTVDQALVMALQRVPFAATLALIVTVAWKLGSIFVQRIMRIHEQRLALARLLVVAKETVYSAASGREMSDETKFREHLKLKLAMLRAHLTTELGGEFQYEPQQESSLDASTDENLAEDHVELHR